MINLFEHTSAHWAKYSTYQWRKAADGQEYLLPTTLAEATVYDPIPLADFLVIDAVNIRLLIFHHKPDDEVKFAIHKFACTYGLLGLMTALPTTPQFIEYEKVYLLKNQFIRQESMDTQEYLNLFFPFNKLNFYKQGLQSV